MSPGPSAALVALILLGASAGAQTPILHGTVRDGATREPIAGAVLTAIDSAGRATTSTIAGADGRFRMPRPAAAMRIRARRIGFRPRDVPITSSALGDSAGVQITMDRLPQVLASVRVTESSHCPGSPEAGAAAQLWAQARDGLLASIVARDAKPARTELLTFDRAQAPKNELVVRHRHRVQSGRTNRAFQATSSAAAFAERGYVHEDRTGRTFNAPDADVLLDESFTATHCFGLVPGTGARVDQIGLAFEPARRRRGIVDVEGVLWLDRVTPALRLLEFRYTDLDRLSMSAGAGGMIEFTTMENGVVLITRWSLRMPVFVARQRSGTTLEEVSESGGLVVSATWPDGVRWTQPIPAVTGTVVEEGSRRPMAHALVTFDGAWDTVTTDTEGRFSLPTVLRGRYDLVALDTSLAGHLAARSVRLLMDVPDDGFSGITFELPSQEESIRRLCASERVPPSTSLLLARIGRADGAPPGKLDVRVTWQRGIAIGAGGVEVREAQRAIEPDEAGRFHLCGVVRDRPISITVRRDGVTVADTAVFVRAATVGRVDVVIPSPERLTEGGAAGHARRTGGRLAGGSLRLPVAQSHFSGPPQSPPATSSPPPHSP